MVLDQPPPLATSLFRW